MGLRVAIYIEPVVFRNDPHLLKVWVNWAVSLTLAGAYTSPTTRYYIISSASLCELFREQTSGLSREAHEAPSCIALSQADCLASMEFDRFQYARDLFASEAAPITNMRLFEALCSAAEATQADIVLSLSQNRYLRPAFACALGKNGPRSQAVLFSELSPLPRRSCPATMFLDPAGHQTQSLLATRPTQIQDAPISDGDVGTLTRSWDRWVGRPTRFYAGRLGVSEFLEQKRQGRRVLLLAMQPPDWLTYEGCYGTISPDNLIARVASDLPEGWVLLPVYHPQYSLSPATEALLQSEATNILFAPSAMACGSAEIFLPFVDAVGTISSTVGIQGLLWGKPLIALGRSFLAGLGYPNTADLETIKGPTPEQRAGLLRFLTHRYCHLQRQLFGQAGYLNRFLRTWADESFAVGGWFDFTQYDCSAADYLLAPHWS